MAVPFRVFRVFRGGDAGFLRRGDSIKSYKPDPANRRQPLGLRELLGECSVFAFTAVVADPFR